MDPNNTQAAIDAGKEALSLEQRVEFPDDIDDIPVAINRDGNVVVLTDVIRVHDERAERPRRRKGTATLTEQDSFIAHILRNKLVDSVIFAEPQKLTAVYNYNPPQPTVARDAPLRPAAWGDHRAVYPAPLSDELVVWDRFAGSELTQEKFAKFLEERFDDLTDHPGNKEQKIPPCTRLDLLGLCEHLELYTKGAFKKTRRRDGTTLTCTGEERGEGSTVIPPRFALSIPIYLGGEVYPIEARLGLQINKDGVPLFTFELLRLDAVKREAFAAVRAAVAEQTGLPVFAGSPEM